MSSRLGRNDQRSVFLVLALLNALWAPVNFVVRTATSHGMTPSAVALLRWGSLTILLFGLLAIPAYRGYVRAKWPTPRDAFWAFLNGMLFFGPAHLMYYLAIQSTSTVEGAVFNTTAPLWTAGLAFLLLGEKPTSRRVLAIGLGLVGAWFVGIGFHMPSLNAAHTVGNLVYLTAVVAETIVSVLTARLIRRSSGMTILAFQVMGTVPTLLLVPLLLPGVYPLSVAHATWQAWLAVAYLLLIPSLVCFGTWYRYVERVPLSVMVVTLLIQPPLAAIIGWLFLGERYGVNVFAGAVLVLGALLVGASEQPSDRLGTVHEVTHDEQDQHERAPSGEHI